MGRQINLGGAKRVHFIGIGGISMSGLAEILFKDGFVVSGSDRTATPTTAHLKDVGINVVIGADANNITSAIDLVVYTAAIKAENPELSMARSLNIPTMVRAELLGAILKGYEYAVCVAGTHGKTSTTALLTGITQAAGLDPTVNIGGYIGGGTNYYIGSSPYFILEACEYSNSFHHWHPHIGVILNIDADHMDFYENMDAIIGSFATFAKNIRPGGMLVIQEGIPGFDEIVAGLKCKVITFGGESSRYQAKNIVSSDGTSIFDITEDKGILTRINLPLPGEYNIMNTLAAYAVARELGIEPEIIARALSQTEGVKRRFEHKGNFRGANIIDDYAHHPTEIKASLAAARSTHPGRIVCLFQPHTYTRTKTFFEDFANSFTDADIIIFVPIYAAREPFDPTISSSQLSRRVAEIGQLSISYDSLKEAEEFLRGKLLPDDLLITMGAGDVYLVGERLLE